MPGRKGAVEILGFAIGVNKEAPIQLIEMAGRTAYKSGDKITDYSAVKFVEMIRKLGHESVIEHSSATVRFTGCSRAFTHQLVRHRLMAITQESQRYCDESGFFQNDYFVVPPSLEEAGLVDWYCGKLKQIDNWYKELQEKLKEAIKAGKTKGKVNEDARFLLPNAVCSEIVVTCNFREWRHIFKMRTDTHAQWEIRYVMVDLLRQFQELFPVIFDDFKIAENGRSAKKIDLLGQFQELFPAILNDLPVAEDGKSVIKADLLRKFQELFPAIFSGFKIAEDGKSVTKVVK